MTDISKIKKIQMPNGTQLGLPDGFDWIGTKAEYDTAWATGAIQSDWICMITDDAASSPTRADVDLSNLTSTGLDKFANKNLSNLTSTGLDKFSNKDLSNLSDTGHKMMDGQWVAKTQELSTATAVNTYTIDLGPNGLNYLPNDNYNYEVMVKVAITNSNNQATDTYTYLYNSDDFKILTSFSGSGGQNQSGTYIIPVTTTRLLYWQLTRTLHYNKEFYAVGYRRIGLNS